MQLNKLHWKTYYCIYQAVPHTVNVSVSKCPKLHSYKNTNRRIRDLVSTEELYCMVVTHAPTVNPCWDFAQESKWPEIKHHRQSTRLVCHIFGTSMSVLLAFFFHLQIKGTVMERMTVTYEKWKVLHHENVQQSTAGRYSHFVIDIQPTGTRRVK